jgi:signal transduction histidine kinase
VLAHARSVRASSGTLLGAVATLHDVTQRREDERLLHARNTELAEANVELAKSVAELETFAGALSHDLKSPLATAFGYVQLLSHLFPEHGGSAEYREFLAAITDGIDGMRTLIDQVLEYATAPGAHLQLAPVDFGALVSDIAAARINAASHGARVGGPVPAIIVDPLPAVLGDRAMLQRVLENLIDNAVKYTEPGQAARVRITAHRERVGWIRVNVVDHGIGIPEGQHDAVFASLHRAHREASYPGTGLGLTICQRIIQRHGGDIGALPQPGGGTCFWLTLRAADASAPAESDRQRGLLVAGTTNGPAVAAPEDHS